MRELSFTFAIPTIFSVYLNKHKTSPWKSVNPLIYKLGSQKTDTY